MRELRGGLQDGVWPLVAPKGLEEAQKPDQLGMKKQTRHDESSRKCVRVVSKLLHRNKSTLTVVRPNLLAHDSSRVAKDNPSSQSVIDVNEPVGVGLY